MSTLAVFKKGNVTSTSGVPSENIFMAEFFANMSAHPAATQWLLQTDIQSLMSEWCRSTCLKLQLYSEKATHNLKVMQSEKNKTRHGPVYNADIFPMQALTLEECLKDGAVDIVFINGLDGSVFHTWRQHDDSHNTGGTKLWPRDWLAVDLPGTRLIGINVSAKAFLWSLWKEPQPMVAECRRTLDARAFNYRTQLEEAGVGQNRRSIIWVTHSMGGLLVKNILRQSELNDGKLASATKGVFFISAPHTGARALSCLYARPFRWLLTLEARELQRNAEPLHQLHKWFQSFINDNKVQVLSLVETKTTHIHTWYYTVLNPEVSSLSSWEFMSHHFDVGLFVRLCRMPVMLRLAKSLVWIPTTHILTSRALVTTKSISYC